MTSLSLRGVRRGGRRGNLIYEIATVTFGALAMTTFLLSPSFAEKITFKTNDKTVLHAIGAKPAAGKPVVVMLHGMAAGKDEWRPLGAELEKMGWGWFAYDQRGHGESSLTRDANGNPDGYKYLGRPGPGSEWEKMVDDTGAAIGAVQTNWRVDRSKIVLAGASVGANIALKYAALTNNIRAVVLLSPGLNYVEFKPLDYIANATASSILIVVSKADQYAFASSEKLKSISPTVELWTDVKAGHGVQMFDAKLLSRITAWMKKRIAAR